jgi:outer membrane protein OmpA-like peptidoglycan-associated protein
MKHLALTSIFFYVFIVQVLAQIKTVSSDTEWAKQNVFLSNGYEAEFIVRVGDVDNLGFGWEDGFDPFCSNTTTAHYFPWEANPSDLPGMDRILLSSKFKGLYNLPCGNDGYAEIQNLALTKPVPYKIPSVGLQEVDIKNAYIQLFIDDFQAPVFCSAFKVTINNIRFVEAERTLNAISQTGPVGKLITIPLPEEFFPAINSGHPLVLSIDETNGAGDGFAIDFIRLLVNRIRLNSCKGNISGTVLDKETNQPIAGALVTTNDKNFTTSNSEGFFLLKDVSTGFEVITGSFSGYLDGYASVDVMDEQTAEYTTIYLEPAKKTVQFNNQNIAVGESIVLNSILFDQGKFDLRSESFAELDKVIALLKSNTAAEIELSGHTSSEGEINYNRSLSYKRVKSCKDYMVSKGIDPGRIVTIGYGPDKPVAPNNSEANRAKNRRVELRLTKL